MGSSQVGAYAAVYAPTVVTYAIPISDRDGGACYWTACATLMVGVCVVSIMGVVLVVRMRRVCQLLSAHHLLLLLLL